jgi:hypothetical protein
VAHRWASLATLNKLPASRAQRRLFELLREAARPKKKNGAIEERETNAFEP